MDDKVVKATELVNHVSHDLSILGLISDAGLVVKLVMLLLFLASFWSWAIIFDKLMTFKSVNKSSDNFEKQFWSGQLLEQLYERIKGHSNHPLANIFVAVMHEWGRTNISQITGDIISVNGIKERVSKITSLICSKEVDKMERGLIFLAIIGSGAPFLGLFGTVWGIMNSFQSIAASKNTTLAVVAPGIAEALLATAVGLFAAIPASFFYNMLSNKINVLYSRMADFSEELSILLFRELEEGNK